jgi:hypothetical protein
MEALIYRTDKIQQPIRGRSVGRTLEGPRTTGPITRTSWRWRALVLGYKSTLEKEPIALHDAQLAAIKQS